jgi:hypothetical protein
VLFSNHRVGNLLGCSSILFAAVPIVYIFHADAFPNHALTETAVLLGGIGGSLLAALIAGAVGSRWWFMATLAAAADLVCLWGFNP